MPSVARGGRSARRFPPSDVLADGVFPAGAASVVFLVLLVVASSDASPWIFWVGFVQAAWLFPLACIQRVRGFPSRSLGTACVGGVWLVVQACLTLAFGLVPAINTP